MDIFKFKQFDVDQTGCAMKVNTDGVLLGALIEADNPKSIIDIGTGTGVIALMLAQRFANARIDAVEIDRDAAEMAGQNFSNAQYHSRLTMHFNAFEDFFDKHKGNKYDLIVSNPPFFLDSLISSNNKKNLARHTDGAFFERLLGCIFNGLNDVGTCQLIVPIVTAAVIKDFLPKHQLYLHKVFSIKSFVNSVPHREIIIIGKDQKQIAQKSFVIYDAPKVYSAAYRAALKDFLTIF
ncbi:tRNA1(Val) (adenine(37)-N6)-methyltransferase [Mucilaginibacter phyllosphaerae]|uniref:tRNA1(Val) (adenine(37)-N6)-methyltransferase n=1 Tax=Mucilaginibacter phyllosphaerae TaxID=1812349 RepID=A0A4Y8AJC1_9SPHI|nr:methyltransferase [Mucilaginibacter phyllosphaerae]MBB3971351.1 tRNA1Val (adenine37-N6)-methyltransferase [Mucilaginibacter phyllosphaerae]TEW68599.1 methyltransferase domain-containing protein [Mucilaginibacter phyllosphaerae]GGH23948.1 tRNA1(Val) (adenine(37)-N6)-methyltransferase [Mucilaginibacter phyllosphaerae]